MFEESTISRWRKYNEKYRLEGNQCTRCSKSYYPKKHLCTCGSTNFDIKRFIGKGTLLTFTQINIPPDCFKDMAPYIIGIIQLSQGPKLMSQITDVELKDLKIGIKMQSVFRKYYTSSSKNIINYGIKFIPAKWSFPQQAAGYQSEIAPKPPCLSSPQLAAEYSGEGE